jgi:catechol 1,2-dioxygenase
VAIWDDGRPIGREQQASQDMEEPHMTHPLLTNSPTKDLLDRIAGLDSAAGDPRLKQIVQRVVSDLFRIIEDLDVQPAEFWSAVSYLTELGQANEGGLLVAGLGIEHFLDLRLDEAERQAGLEGGTPRTIEGPLYIADAPLSQGEARLDDGREQGEVLFMGGRVLDTEGRPVAGAVVDVWHANTLGGYSFFDPSQAPWNLRRRIETDGEGRYRFRSLLPSGYAVPVGGPTERLLSGIGRHGHRPAHIHFFVSAPGFRQLTTQINIDGDAYLHDDFAFATRDELIPAVHRIDDPAEIHAHGLNAAFARIEFDFTLHQAVATAPDTVVARAHAKAA